MMRLLRRLKQKEHQDLDHWQQTLENVSVFREVIFTTIESVIILGALQAAFSKHPSPVLWAMTLLGWIALSGYLFVLGRYLINVVNGKWELIRNRDIFAWVAGILPIFISFMITYGLSAAIAEIISINFMGAVATN